MQQCSAAAVARSETHALASTSGRGRSASVHVRRHSLSCHGHGSAAARSQHTQSHPAPRFVRAAGSSSSSRHGSTAQTEPLNDCVDGPRGSEATADYAARHGQWLGDDGGSNGARKHDAAGSRNGADTEGSDADEDGFGARFGSEEASDAEDDDAEAVGSSISPPVAMTDTSVLERVRHPGIIMLKTFAGMHVSATERACDLTPCGLVSALKD